MSQRRVVVTGIGALTPLGLNVEDTWQGILAGKSGIRLIDIFDTTDYSTKFSGTIQGYDPAEYMDAKEIKKFDCFVKYGVAAATQAIRDSGIEVNDENTHRFGVAMGSGIGGLANIEKNHQILLESGPRRVSPFFIPGSIINILPGYVSICFGLKGPNLSIVTACTTGAHNIGMAARMIRYGDADIMLAGGAEMGTTQLGLAGFSACRALSKRNDEPTKASRPWDKDRDGFVLGDGAGALVLEEYESAKKRGARIYAELIGYGMSGDAYHMTQPDPSCSGFIYSMNNAIRDAELNVEDVHYVNAHATSTHAGDELEARAVMQIFSGAKQVPAMSSTKSMIGHLLGAAGAVEAIFSILALRDQVAPPTINLDNPFEGCTLNLVPHQAQPMKMNVALSNSFGFGGTNGTLIFKKIR